jgi:serine protease Do
MRIWNIGVIIALSLTAPAPQDVARAKPVVSFADVAEKAIPGVVNIRTTSYTRRDDPSLDLYQFFMGGRIPSLSTHSVGSGVVIDGSGFILTNNHVISGATAIEILFASSKRKVRAKVVGTDPKTDLALVKIENATGTFPLPLGDSDKLRVGDVVAAIGNPFGYAHTVTSGIISAKGRVIGTGPWDDFLQTDASIHPGNSGGPLIDINGNVVGINTAVSSEGQGIGFAIPINAARTVVRDLMRWGKVRRPFLGMVGKDILSREDLETNESPDIHGFIVSNLVVAGPAAKAGTRIGDLVVALDDQKVLDVSHVQRLLAQRAPSDRVRLRVYRRGRGFLNLNVALKETPPAKDLPMERDLF